MLSRRSWITAFVGHVLRRGLADDPGLAQDVAEEVYPVWASWDPEVAADSAFDIFAERPGSGALKLH